MPWRIVDSMYFVLIPALIASVAPEMPSQSVYMAAPVMQSASISTRYGTPLLQKTISLSLKRVSVREAVTEIARAADIRLSADDDALTRLKTSVTIVDREIAVGEAFKIALNNSGLGFAEGPAGRVTISRLKKVTAAQGVIAGKVLDARAGKGISGASVAFGNEIKVVTGEDGSYRMLGIPAGVHALSVRSLGYVKQTKQVTVTEGATASVDFKLEPSSNVLDQVVVTGTIVQTELKAVPNAISVITAKDIEQRGITRIDQLFRGDIPGLFALNPTSFNSLDDVSMFSRGATALTSTSSGTQLGSTNTIKTYVDGVEMSDSKYLSQIDPASIERIEILTGPQASTVYGSNAINGVMQIFTKRGQGNSPKLTFNVASGITENSSNGRLAPNHLLDGRVAGAEGRFSYNIGSSWDYQGSWTPGKQTQRTSAYGGAKIVAEKVTADLSARRGFTKNRQRGDLTQSYTDLTISGVWNPSAFQGLRRSNDQSLTGRTMGLSLSYRPFSRWSHELVLGNDASTSQSAQNLPTYRPGGIDTLLSVSYTNTSRTSQTYSSTLQLAISSSVNLNLTFGGDHWRTAGSSWFASSPSLTGSITNPNVTRDKPDKNSGAYIQGQIGFIDALFFTYGIRGDWNPNFGARAKVKPGRYGVSYTRDLGAVSAKVRGSYGRSIRPPRQGIALATAETSVPVINQFGNLNWIKESPDLGPEHQSGGEGGIELYLGNRGSLVVTRFNQTVDNLIGWVFYVDSIASLQPVFPSTANCNTNRSGTITFDSDGRCFVYQSQYLNVGSIRNQGWETQGSVNAGPFTARATYSWVKSRIGGVTPRYKSLLTGPEYQAGRSFTYLPEHTWALGLTYAQSRSTVALALNGIGNRPVGQTELNLAASASNRYQLLRPRMDLSFSNYLPISPRYTTADLNSTYRFSSRLDALLQITNLTDYHSNDYNGQYISAGRASRAGLRLRW